MFHLTSEKGRILQGLVYYSTSFLHVESHAHVGPEEFIDRGIPTVFVKMDLPIEYSISQTIPNIIPFVAITTVEDKYSKNYHR